MAANHYGQYDGLPDYGETSFDADSSKLSHSNPASDKRPRSEALEALAALPEVRSIPWRPGKETTTESERRQTKGAFLMVTRGVSRTPRCNKCLQGVGRFSLCVSLPGWFGGSCATCQMNCQGNQCSLRGEKAVGNAKDKTITTGPNQSSSVKRKRKSTDHDVAINSHLQEFSSSEVDNGPKGSFYAAQSNFTSGPPAPQSSDAPQTSGPEDNSSLLQYVYQKLNPPNGKKRHHILDQTTSGAQESLGQLRRTLSDVNAAGRVSFNREQLAEDGSNSLSPSAQLLQPAPHAGSYSNRDSIKRTEAREDGSQETPLFDSLPRKKQKQILGLIGGLQSGIRTTKQQTDNLQKQLDLLQSALGIDVDEEDDG